MMSISEGAARAAVYDEARGDVDHPLHGYVYAELVSTDAATLADALMAPGDKDWKRLKQDYDRLNGYLAKLRYFLMIRMEEASSHAPND